MQGVCCTSGVLDGGGFCCASGVLDECGICDGLSTSCSLRIRAELKVRSEARWLSLRLLMDQHIIHLVHLMHSLPKPVLASILYMCKLRR